MAKFKADPSWRGRRRAVASTLLSCLGVELYAMSLGVEMAQVVTVPLAGLAGAALGYYVAGASYERTSGIPSQNRIVEDETVKPS